MGAAASIANWNQREIMTVDLPGPGWRRVKTFSRAIFKKFEWETLKMFCQKYHIPQRNLVHVFQQYLAGDEAYVREFKVRALDARNKFAKYSNLFQELADVFIPAMYLRNFAGLVETESVEDISFARFIIHSYIFGCQHFPDLLYDLFAVLRQKLDIQLSVVISPFSVSKIVDILTEEFEESGTLKTLKAGLKRLEQGPDVRLYSIIHMGIKYPLMFYAVERFRKLYKRIVFGDKFWAGRKYIKIRHVNMGSYLDEDLDTCFASVEAATRRTALSIITDSLLTVQSTKAWVPTDMFRLSPTELSAAQVTQLKHFLGYKAARAVLLESGIALEGGGTPAFLQSHLVTVPVASPPSKTLPVSPWRDSDMEESPDVYSDYYDSHPSSPNHPLPATSSSPPPRHSHGHSHGHSQSNVPLIGYDIDDSDFPTTEHHHPSTHDDGVAPDDYLRAQLFPAQPADTAEDTQNETDNVRNTAAEDRDGVLVIRDTQFNREFRYDVQTGRSRWQQLFVDSDGQVVREVFS